MHNSSTSRLHFVARNVETTNTGEQMKQNIERLKRKKQDYEGSDEKSYFFLLSTGCTVTRDKWYLKRKTSMEREIRLDRVLLKYFLSKYEKHNYDEFKRKTN